MAYDGIYSGYLTQYYGPGRYHVSVMVTDNSGNAHVMTMSEPGQCCGSMVPHSPENLAPIGLFRRGLSGPGVQVVSVLSENMEENIRPGKIGDLSITVTNTSQLVLDWTAPGGDFNSGTVVTYRFVYSHNIEELVRTGTPQALEGLKRTDVAGTRVQYEISFPYYNQDYYIGVAASDAHGNRGRMSNIVLVNIAAPDTGAGNDDNVSPNTDQSHNTNWILIGAVIGGVAFLILTIILIVCIFKCCRTKSRFSQDKFAKSLKSSGVKVEFPSPAQSETTDTSSYESEQQQHTGPKPHSSTSFAANLTPTYWSASQLLGQHEIRSSSDPSPDAGQHEAMYRQNLVLPENIYKHQENIYNVNGYYPDTYDVHNNYGYYGSEPGQDYNDYYPYQAGPGHSGHRHSSASVDMYGHFMDDHMVTTRPDNFGSSRPDQRELDLRNITQV